MAKSPTTKRARKKALDQALRAMFGRLEAKPVSDRLKSVVDQLDVADSPVSNGPVKKVG
jgi:hypothetical protein